MGYVHYSNRRIHRRWSVNTTSLLTLVEKRTLFATMWLVLVSLKRTLLTVFLDSLLATRDVVVAYRVLLLSRTEETLRLIIQVLQFNTHVNRTLTSNGLAV